MHTKQSGKVKTKTQPPFYFSAFLSPFLPPHRCAGCGGVEKGKKGKEKQNKKRRERKGKRENVIIFFSRERQNAAKVPAPFPCGNGGTAA